MLRRHLPHRFSMDWVLVVTALTASAAVAAATPPVPTQAQLDLMDVGLAQFMHFSVEPFKSPHIEHNCVSKSQPCLPASIFNPSNLSTEQWVETAVSFGAKEICLTAHHEGGFALWPTQHNLGYSVAASPYGKDIVKQFVASCRKHGVRICYYIGPNANGWLNNKNVSVHDFLELQLGQYQELLENYGPISRFWWDHYRGACNGKLDPCPGGFPNGWDRFTSLIRQASPSTIICPGPDCSGHLGEGGTGQYPVWYNCDVDPANPGKCNHHLGGKTFHPFETCVTPIKGWFAAGDGTKLLRYDLAGYWNLYRSSVGIGYVNTINAPPGTTGQIPTDVTDIMLQFGKLISPLARPAANTSGTGDCAQLTIELDTKAISFNTVVLREGLRAGQRIVKYAIDHFSGGAWKTFPTCPGGSHHECVHGQSVGAMLIDSLPHQAAVDKVRFRCLEAAAGPVMLASFAVTTLLPPAGAVPPNMYV
mmetsp:Transcript_126896/g.353350  ORF Transcript_126896/g.353350 Transcript_126896/m.353350 type:complete len:477 (+) Transcript_126896:52-1482(+)